MTAYIKKISITKYLKLPFSVRVRKRLKFVVSTEYWMHFFALQATTEICIKNFETVYQREPVLCNVKSHLLHRTYQTDYFAMGQKS